MPAILFATLAMVFFWRGRGGEALSEPASALRSYGGSPSRNVAEGLARSLYFVLGSACLVVGFFVKQTVAIFSAVPMVVLLLLWRLPRRSEVLFALLPVVASAGTIVMLKTLKPTVDRSGPANRTALLETREPTSDQSPRRRSLSRF
jgi:hypothetical protein